MLPSNLLFASTTAETGDSPKLSGISPSKLQLFTKIASKVGFENSSLGSLPKNSLNRISRYTKLGMSRTTNGKDPLS